MTDPFSKLITIDYYIDKSPALREMLQDPFKKFLLCRPRRWGKTTFLQMVREFFSIHINQKTGEEIELTGFSIFENLRIVTEDEVNVEDLIYLFQNIEQVKEKNPQTINQVYDYFNLKNYPWFYVSSYRLTTEQKIERIDRMYKNTRRAFSNEIKLSNLTLNQVKATINQLKAHAQKGIAYCQLLSTFGKACMHFQKYPCIFVEFPYVYKLSSKSDYQTDQETDIMNSIAEIFKKRHYHINYLSDKITEEKNKSVAAKYEISLKMFMSYYQSQSKPDESIKFLSKQLFNRYQIPTVVLFDEYDKPMNSGFLLGEVRYFQVKDCMSKVFACLKNEETIQYTFITGVNRFAKTELFSGLNNLREQTILDSQYADAFGFTEKNVRDLVNKYNQKNPTNQVDYDALRDWFYNYQIEGIFYFNPFSVLNCLTDSGKLDSYWVQSGNSDMLLEILKKLQESEKEVIIKNLLYGEVKFIPLKYQNWEKIKQPTPQIYYSFLLHTGHLSLAVGQKISPVRKSTFIVPNKEIKYLVNSLMNDYYRDVLNKTCFDCDFDSIIGQASSNNFIRTFNDHCLSKIEQTNIKKISEANFEAMIFGIFFVLGKNLYKVKILKRTGQCIPNAVFYPLKNSSQKKALLHEYKMGTQKNREEMVQNALWQCLTRNYLHSVVTSNNNQIMGQNCAWDGVILRGIAFYLNEETNKWCVSSEEYTLSLQQIEFLLKIFSGLANSNNKSQEALLSGNSGNKQDIENQRTAFLKKHNATKLSDLIGQEPFQYPNQDSSKINDQLDSKRHKLERKDFNEQDNTEKFGEESDLEYTSRLHQQLLQVSNTNNNLVLNQSQVQEGRSNMQVVSNLNEKRNHEEVNRKEVGESPKPRKKKKIKIRLIVKAPLIDLKKGEKNTEKKDKTNF